MKKDNWFSSLLAYSEGNRGKFILSIILSVLSIVSGLIPYFAVYKVIECFASHTVTSSVIWKWCLVALLFYILKILLFSFSTGLSHSMAYHTVAGLRMRVADRFLHAPLGEVQKLTIGEIKNLVVDKIENIEPPLAHMVPEGAGHIVLPIVSIAALFMIDWRIALSSLVTLPVAIVSMGLTFAISGKNFQKYNESNAHMASTIVEYTEGIEVIKAFGRSGVSYEKFSNAITEYETFVLKWLASTWVTMKLAFAVAPSTLIGTLPVSLLLAGRGEITSASAALAVMLSMSMVSSLAKLEVFSENLRQMRETVEEIEEYLNLPTLGEPERSGNVSSFDIKLENVHFSYDEEEVLHGIDLDIPSGSFTALVGPSGSGKSTIAKLISRFWDVGGGKITIGGVDIRNIRLEDLAGYVSFVTQDNFLFRCSLLENIRMGRPSATDDEVMAAARAAQCEEFIMKLPLGYDTPAGEAGKRLSGGEKQRIAIARMMLKDSPIVILDEATAFTDPENEDKIERSITELTRGKTLLVIAHRLSTICKADNIVVLENGNIASEGTQEELLEKSPLYRDMWQAHIGAKEWAVSRGKEE